MGNSTSRAPASSTPASTPPRVNSRSDLESTLARQTLELREARDQAAKYHSVASAALAEQERLRKDASKVLPIAVAGAAATAAVAAALAVFITRRQYTAQLTAAAQNLTDLRRRSALEVSNAQRFGSEKLVKSLLPALDSMDALVTSPPDAEGARLTRAALLDALRANAVKRLEPAVGDRFDVDVHEAMLAVPGEEVGTIASVLRPGYRLHDERVLRAAQVGVITAAEPTPPSS